MGELTRLFLAVALPDEVRDLMAAVLTDRIGSRLPSGLVPPRNWHLTLRFFGDADPVTTDRLVAGLDQADLGERFTLELGGVGTFPAARRATVLWVGVGAGAGRLGELAEAVEDVAESVGFEPEERPFKPHLTIARLRPALDLRSLVASVDVPPVSFQVDSVALFASALGGGPPRYQPLEWFDLDR